MSNNDKIWGKKYNLFTSDKVIIDMLYLKANTFCSSHTHKTKYNRFIGVSGKVEISTIFASKILKKDDIFEVEPNIKHRFKVLTNAIMIEISYVLKGKIKEDDIIRESLGGKIIDGVEYTIDELKEKGLLEL